MSADFTEWQFTGFYFCRLRNLYCGVVRRVTRHWAARNRSNGCNLGFVYLDLSLLCVQQRRNFYATGIGCVQINGLCRPNDMMIIVVEWVSGAIPVLPPLLCLHSVKTDSFTIIVVGFLGGARDFSFLCVHKNCGTSRFVIVNYPCVKVAVCQLTAADVLAAVGTHRWEHFT